MNEFRWNRLNRHRTGGSGDNIELALPAPKSPTGKVHLCCPADGCTPSIFQLGDTDGRSPKDTPLVRREPGTSGVTCPYCGHDGSEPDFMFRGDIKAAEEWIAWAVHQDAADYISDALEQMAAHVNRSQRRGGMFSLNITTNRSSPEPPPFVWREDLLRDLTCDICSRRYGVYAVALFCPDCGARNVHLHFDREVELVKQQLELAKRAETENGHELAYRLLGNAHEDVLTAFETYLKTLYRFLVRRRLPDRADELCAKKAIGNRFQNVQRGRDLFSVLSFDPYDSLTPDELAFLGVNIKKRHVVGHNLSMVDDAYRDAATTESLGETVSLAADEVERFANLCWRVVVRLEESCVEFLPRAAGPIIALPLPKH